MSHFRKFKLIPEHLYEKLNQDKTPKQVDYGDRSISNPLVLKLDQQVAKYLLNEQVPIEERVRTFNQHLIRKLNQTTEEGDEDFENGETDSLDVSDNLKKTTDKKLSTIDGKESYQPSVSETARKQHENKIRIFTPKSKKSNYQKIKAIRSTPYNKATKKSKHVQKNQIEEKVGKEGGSAFLEKEPLNDEGEQTGESKKLLSNHEDDEFFSPDEASDPEFYENEKDKAIKRREEKLENTAKAKIPETFLDTDISTSKSHTQPDDIGLEAPLRKTSASQQLQHLKQQQQQQQLLHQQQQKVQEQQQFEEQQKLLTVPSDRKELRQFLKKILSEFFIIDETDNSLTFRDDGATVLRGGDAEKILNFLAPLKNIHPKVKPSGFAAVVECLRVRNIFDYTFFPNSNLEAIFKEYGNKPTAFKTRISNFDKQLESVRKIDQELNFDGKNWDTFN